MADVAAHGDETYLESVVRLLWPSPARVIVTGRRGARRAGPLAHRRFVAVPSARSPKLLVPRRPRRVAAGAVRNFKTAATARQRAQIGALSLGFRFGGQDWLPDHVVISSSHGEPEGIDSHLRDVLGDHVHVSLYIGPARAVRKPVLQVLDDRGNTLAFAKLGVDEFTTDLVRAEATAVRRFVSYPTRVLRVPDVLHDGTWNGHALLVQSALPRGDSVTSATKTVAEAAWELAHLGGVTRSNLVSSTYWARLTQRVHDLAASSVSDRLARALAEIIEVHAHTSVEFGCSHGDYAPWNMTALAGRVLVWDWEKFEHDTPLGFDMIHCDVQGAVVVAATAPTAAFASARERAEELIGQVGNTSVAELVVWLYTVDIATRYLTDREPTDGLQLSNLPNWLPDALDCSAAEARS